MSVDEDFKMSGSPEDRTQRDESSAKGAGLFYIFLFININLINIYLLIKK